MAGALDRDNKGQQGAKPQKAKDMTILDRVSLPKDPFAVPKSPYFPPKETKASFL